MGKMVRKQIYIDAEQDEALKQKARELGISEAELVRASLDHLFTALADSAGAGKSALPMLSEAPQATYEATRETREGKTMAELTDRILRKKGLGSTGNAIAREDKAAWEQELAFMEERSRMQAGDAGTRWSREDLYDERL